MNEENLYLKELKKFEKAECVVIYQEGPEVKEIVGQVRGLSYSHLSCVVMTEKDKILIKHLIRVTRPRNPPNL